MKNKEILTRQNICWHIVDMLLYEIQKSDLFCNDEDFRKLYYPLYNYVGDKLALPTDDEIVETCVLVVQKPSNT